MFHTIRLLCLPLEAYFAFVLSFILFGATAKADVLFTNGPLTDTNSLTAISDDHDSTITGSVFTASLSGTAETLSFAGTYNTGNLPTSDSFTLRLYSGAGTPGLTNLLDTSAISVSRNQVFADGGGGTPVYEFSGSIGTPFSLTAGSSYVLAISDSDSPYEQFAVYGPGDSGSSYQSLDEGATYPFPVSGQFEFSLSGPATAPEPSTWAMALGGCVVLALVYHHTRKA